jgi:predicted nucleotidyltransferase
MPALARQHHLIARLRTVLLNDPSCLGAAVGGSLAELRGDRWSDVDMIIYCKTGEARSLMQAISGVAADKPVVYRLEGSHDDFSVYEKVILEDWSSYELHVVEPSARMRLRPPYIEVANRSGYLASRLSDEKPIGRETVRPYASGRSGLEWELFNCMKWLRRGEVGIASRYLQDLGAKLASDESGHSPQ